MRSMRCIPLNIDRVARSHSATTRMSPVPEHVANKDGDGGESKAVAFTSKGKGSCRSSRMQAIARRDQVVPTD
jgi:hypothetical protein